MDQIINHPTWIPSTARRHKQASTLKFAIQVESAKFFFLKEPPSDGQFFCRSTFFFQKIFWPENRKFRKLGLGSRGYRLVLFFCWSIFKGQAQRCRFIFVWKKHFCWKNPVNVFLVLWSRSAWVRKNRHSGQLFFYWSIFKSQAQKCRFLLDPKK